MDGRTECSLGSRVRDSHRAISLKTVCERPPCTLSKRSFLFQKVIVSTVWQYLPYQPPVLKPCKPTWPSPSVTRLTSMEKNYEKTTQTRRYAGACRPDV